MESIRWNEPLFGEEEIEEVSKALKNNFLNEGPKTRELEKILRDYLGVKYVILTTSATAGLFLAIKAEAIKRGVFDFEVIVPSLTMFASASSVDWAGGKPILVDSKEDNLTIDVSKIKEKITEKTIAIMPVHILGRGADIKSILEITRKHNLAVIEDAAGALGSKQNDKFLGTFGDIGVYSLQSNKIASCGQGGIIVLNDDKLYEIISRLRDFGRYDKSEFMHNEIGYNLKFSDLAASVAIPQINKIHDRKKLLINQLKRYKQNLQEVSQVKFFEFKEGEIPLWVDAYVKDRDKLIDFLKSNNIFSRACWPAIHRNKPYENQGWESYSFQNSGRASDNVIWLPNGPGKSLEKIDFICEKIKEFYTKGENARYNN